MGSVSPTATANSRSFSRPTSYATAGYALPTRAWFSGMAGSAGLPVGGVPAAPAAVLLQLDPVGVVPLVLPGGVVAVLADGTGQGDGGPDVGGRHGGSFLRSMNLDPTVRTWE